MDNHGHSFRFEIEQLRDFKSIGADAWTRLLSVASDATVFQTYSWLTAWWKQFSDGRDLMLLKAHSGSRIVGLAPLFCTNSHNASRHQKSVRFIGEEHADYLTFIVDAEFPEVHELLLEYLLTKHTKGIECEFDQVPEDSAFAAALRKIGIRGDVYFNERERTICPYVKVSNNSEVVEKLLRKESIRRSTAKLKKLGELSVEHVRKSEAISPYLERFFDQHDTRWAATKYPSLFRQDSNRRFYEGLVNSTHDDLDLVFTILRLDDEAIAYHFGFLSAEDLIWYKPSFDLAMHKLSPGEILLKELLAFANASDCNRLDFSRGNEDFKFRFATGTRSNVSYTFSTMPSRLTYFMRVARTKLRSGLREILLWSSKTIGVPSNDFLQLIQYTAADHTLSSLQKVRSIAGHVFRRARHLTYSSHEIYMFESGPHEPLEPYDAPVELGLELLLDADRFTTIAERDELLQKAFPRIKSGDRCYAMLNEGKVVAYGWATTKSPMPVTEVGVKLDLSEGDICLYDFVVYPTSRRKGVYGKLLAQLRAHHSNSRVLIYTLSDNVGSIRGIHRAGFQKVYSLTRRVILGHEFVHRQDVGLEVAK
jgi:CelD/BcsL family acetyltransferase involved in cellulose biosynthesis